MGGEQSKVAQGSSRDGGGNVCETAQGYMEETCMRGR